MSLENYRELSDKVNKEKSKIDKNKNGLDTAEAKELSTELMKTIKESVINQNAANITRIWDKISSDVKKVKGLELQEKPKNNKESIELIQKLINGSCVDENGSKIQVTVNGEMSNDTLAKIFIIQQSLGIKVDGVFGPETIQSIVKKCNGESEKVVVNENLNIISDVGLPADVKSKLVELQITKATNNPVERQTLDFSKYPGLSLIKKKDNSYIFSIDKSGQAKKEISLNQMNVTSEIKEIFKSKVDEIVNPKVEKPNVDLSKNIPKEAEKFGITKENIKLLNKYGLAATFEYANTRTNDRVDITNSNDRFETIKFKKQVTDEYESGISAISLTSNGLKPNYKIKIEEKDNKLYIEQSDDYNNKFNYIIGSQNSKEGTKAKVEKEVKKKETKEQSEEEKIQDKLHDLGLTSGGGKFDAGRYEGLSLSTDGKKLVYINEKNETKEYDILNVTKEGRKHVKLDDKTTIEKGKTGLGKKLEKLVKKSDGSDTNFGKVLNVGQNIGEITAEGAKKLGKAAESGLNKAAKATDKIVDRIDAAKEKEENERFDAELKKFGLDLTTYNEITKDLTSATKIIDKKYQKQYMHEFSSTDKRQLTNQNIKKEGDKVVIMATESRNTNNNQIPTHSITIDSNKKITIEKKEEQK